MYACIGETFTLDPYDDEFSINSQNYQSKYVFELPATIDFAVITSSFPEEIDFTGRGLTAHNRGGWQKSGFSPKMTEDEISDKGIRGVCHFRKCPQREDVTCRAKSWSAQRKLLSPVTTRTPLPLVIAKKGSCNCLLLHFRASFQWLSLPPLPPLSLSLSIETPHENPFSLNDSCKNQKIIKKLLADFPM